MQAKSSRATAREDLAASYLKQPTLKRGVSDLHHDQYELQQFLKEVLGNRMLSLRIESEVLTIFKCTQDTFSRN